MRLPRLRTVLLALNLAVFFLPLGALTVLRTYDHQLVRQTEAELKVQGALVAELYRHALAKALTLPEAQPPAPSSGDEFAAELLTDVSTDPVWPTAEEAQPPTAAERPEDAVAAKVGRELASVIQGAASQTLAGIRLVDSRGVVVASSRTELGLSLAARQEVAAALAGRPTSLLRNRRERVRDSPVTSASRNTGVRVFVALPVSLGGVVRGAVILSRTPMTLGKAFYQDRYYLLVTALVLLLAVLLVSLLAAGAVVRPVRELAQRAELVANGQSSAATLSHPVTREVAALADAVTRMGTALKQRADVIHALAANVSHEFKTPLTSLRGTIELLQDSLSEMDAQQRSRFLEMLAADTSRLERLVERLLDLARADVVRPGTGKLEVAQVIGELVEQERLEGRTLAVEVAEALPRVQMNREILSAVLGNVVQNARQHGGPGVRVSIAVSTHAGGVRLLVRDNGMGVSVGNRKRIFEPFFTTARSSGGTGLGLTIVQTLVQAHGGAISLVDEAGGGATFAIDLPGL